MRAPALLILLLAAPALAQDETLEPNATSSETNSDCTTANAHTRLSDNSDATLCDGGNANSSENYLLRLDFPTPLSAPSTVTDDQEFQCRVQKSSSGGGTPTVRLDFFCNGVLVESGAEQDVTSTSPVEFSELFTFSTGSCASDGSDAQIEVDVSRTGGSPGGRKSVDSIDCDWDVTHAPAASRRRVLWIGS